MRHNGIPPGDSESAKNYDEKVKQQIDLSAAARRKDMLAVTPRLG